MIRYDFTSCINRRTAGSVKWDMMLGSNPETAEGVLPMSTADMEFLNAPEIVDGLKAHLDHYIFGYTGPTQSYFDALIRWNKERRGIDTPQEWIVHTPGVVNALFHAVGAFSEPGDGIIIMRPVYYPFSYVIERQQRKIVDCPLRIEDGLYRIDFERLETLAARTENKILIFCSPHNPVGRVWTKEELLRVADICAANEILLVSDEIHCDLIMSGFEQHSMLAFDHPIRERLIVATAPTKTFNLAAAGISTSFIVNEEIRERFKEELGRCFTQISNGLAYTISRFAYEQCGSWLDACLQVIERNRDLCIDYFRDDPEVKVYPMEGTYLLWIDFNGLGLSAEELERFMTQEAQIFANEGLIFGEEGRGFSRWNLAIPTDALKETLERYTKARREARLEAE